MIKKRLWITFIIFLFTNFSFEIHRNEASTNQKLVTQLKMYNGRSTLFINGKPHDGIFCSVRSPYMQNFIDAGFDIFDTHPSTPHGWIADNKYDYTKTDEYIEAYLKQKPDALLMIVLIYCPKK